MKNNFTKLALITTLLFTSACLSANEMPSDEERLQELGAMMGQMQEKMKANPNMSEMEQKALMMQLMNKSSGAKSMLQKQKEQMPKVLTLLKSNRSCLSDADSKSDAQVCEEKSIKLAKELGMDDMYDYEEEEEEEFVWNESEKKQALLEMDEGIQQIEKSLPCIEKAQTMSDMMHCSEGMN